MMPTHAAHPSCTSSGCCLYYRQGDTILKPCQYMLGAQHCQQCSDLQQEFSPVCCESKHTSRQMRGHVLYTDVHVHPQHPPRFMLVENVVGFEASPMCAVLRKAMAAINLDMQARCHSVLWTPPHDSAPHADMASCHRWSLTICLDGPHVCGLSYDNSA